MIIQIINKTTNEVEDIININYNNIFHYDYSNNTFIYDVCKEIDLCKYNLRIITE